MNKLIILKRIATFNKVTYYSVQYEGESISLFEKFIEKHTLTNINKLNNVLAWIKVIGNKYGAKEHYFRNESQIADTRALPPIGKNRELKYIEYDYETGEEITTPNNLRLYCFRANESVVVLFDGDVKTAQKAQDCKNVRPHFHLANRLSKALEQAFAERVIIWNDDCTDIDFTNPIEFRG